MMSAVTQMNTREAIYLASSLVTSTLKWLLLEEEVSEFSTLLRIFSVSLASDASVSHNLLLEDPLSTSTL